MNPYKPPEELEVVESGEMLGDVFFVVGCVVVGVVLFGLVSVFG